MTRLHHIALGAHDVERVSHFYRDFFAAEELKRFQTDDGLRAIWLDLGDCILMVEATDDPVRRVEGVGAGPFLLSFAVCEDERAELEIRLEAGGHSIEDRTQFSSYTRDPEGNRVAFSLPVDSLLEE